MRDDRGMLISETTKDKLEEDGEHKALKRWRKSKKQI